MRAMVALLILIGSVGAAVGLEEDNATKARDCRSTKNDAVRLKCFDAAFAAPDLKSDPGEDEAKKPPTPAKVVDAMDLAIAPNKYVEKSIEVRGLQCVFADKDSYRCIANPSGPILIVEAADIEPASEKQRLESACDTAKNIATSACRRTLRFTLASAGHDTVNMLDRTTVSTLAAEVVAEAPKTAARTMPAARYRRR